MTHSPLTPGINALKQVQPPHELRQKILKALASKREKYILDYARFALAISLVLFIGLVGVHSRLYGDEPDALSVSVIPATYVESVLLSSQTISSEVALSTLLY